MKNLPYCAAVVVAAGQGKRMGMQVSKQFLKLCEKEILVHTLMRFEACKNVQEIVVVTAKDDIAYVKGLVEKFSISKVFRVVAGGKERQDSVYSGISQVSEQAELIAVHDGARPFVRVEDISEVIVQADITGAAALGVLVKDTLKKSDNAGNISKTIDRSKLWAIQTPQVFRRKIIMEAFEKALIDGFLGTDECMLAERIGITVRLVAGHYDNIKMTTIEDLFMGEAILKNQEEAGI